MDIAWYVTPDALEAIEIGANVLGTGGGGNPYTVKLYARELLKQGKRIAVVDPLTLPDDALVVAVGMGAPTVSMSASSVGMSSSTPCVPWSVMWGAH